MSALLEHVITGEAVTTPSAGAIGWLVKPGERVTRYQPLATVGELDQLTAPADGKVTILTVWEGATVEAGAVVAYVATEARQKPLEARRPAAAPSEPHKPLERVTEPARARRGHVAPLELVELTPAPVLPRKRTRQTRPRIIKRMQHITDCQSKAFDERLAMLGELGGDYAAAELQRLALALLLQMETSALVRALELQRDEEQRGGYGYGNRP